jgi:hypothetical protein
VTLSITLDCSFRFNSCCPCIFPYSLFLPCSLRFPVFRCLPHLLGPRPLRALTTRAFSTHLFLRSICVPEELLEPAPFLSHPDYTHLRSRD